jgi:preprotein translocase subunit SecG
MSILFNILTLLFIVVSVALVLIVLVQRPQGGGLTGAFGGGGGTDTAFGGRTGDALTVATITAFTIYLLIAIGLNITTNAARSAAMEPASNTAATTDTPAAPGTTPAAPGTTPATATQLTPEEIEKLITDTDPNAPATTPAPAPTPTPVTPAPAPAPGGGL